MNKFPYKPNRPYIPDPYIIPQQKQKSNEMKTPEEMAEEYAWKHYGYSAINHQLDFLAGYKAAQQWISVKDRLPPDGAKVLLIVFGDIHYGWIDQSPSDPTEYCLYFSNTYIDKGHHVLTHWMPLSEAPKEKK